MTNSCPTINVNSYEKIEENSQNIPGNSKKNLICGGNKANNIEGKGANDFLFGMEGNDTLVGGKGDDTLFGGEHKDVLFGGPGKNELHGESGADTFYILPKSSKQCKQIKDLSKDFLPRHEQIHEYSPEDKLKILRLKSISENKRLCPKLYENQVHLNRNHSFNTNTILRQSTPTVDSASLTSSDIETVFLYNEREGQLFYSDGVSSNPDELLVVFEPQPTRSELEAHMLVIDTNELTQDEVTHLEQLPIERLETLKTEKTNLYLTDFAASTNVQIQPLPTVPIFDPSHFKLDLNIHIPNRPDFPIIPSPNVNRLTSPVKGLGMVLPRNVPVDGSAYHATVLEIPVPMGQLSSNIPPMVMSNIGLQAVSLLALVVVLIARIGRWWRR